MKVGWKPREKGEIHEREGNSNEWPVATVTRHGAPARPSHHAEDKSPGTEARGRTGEGRGGVKKFKNSRKSCRHGMENRGDVGGRRKT